MTTHTLNSIKKHKKVYNKIKKSLEKRLQLLIELKNLQEKNLKITKDRILNNKMILNSKIPIEKILSSKLWGKK